MSATICPACGLELMIGDYPFCPHGSIFESSAQRFDPIVVFRSPDGNYTIPGRSNEPTPAGLERVEIRDSRHAQRVEREMSARGRAEAQMAYEADRQGFGREKAELRRQLKEESRHWPGNLRQMADEAIRRSEARKPRPCPSGETIINVMHYNSSNRTAWRDRDTDYKSRKA